MVPNMTQAFLPQNAVPFTQTVATPVAPDNHVGQVNVNELLSKLISAGIIPAATPSPHTAGSTKPSPSAPVEEKQDDNIPDLTSFTMDNLKQRHDSVIAELYTGKKCSLCGMRFTETDVDVYTDHLDGHYRDNRSKKKVTHRGWYSNITNWIKLGSDVTDREEGSKSLIFEKVKKETSQQKDRKDSLIFEKVKQASQQKDVISSVKASNNMVEESCEICAEQFDMDWEEEEEEWQLKNAIRVDGKAYHPSCY